MRVVVRKKKFCSLKGTYAFVNCSKDFLAQINVHKLKTTPHNDQSKDEKIEWDNKMKWKKSSTDTKWMNETTHAYIQCSFKTFHRAAILWYRCHMQNFLYNLVGRIEGKEEKISEFIHTKIVHNRNKIHNEVEITLNTKYTITKCYQMDMGISIVAQYIPLEWRILPLISACNNNENVKHST